MKIQRAKLVSGVALTVAAIVVVGLVAGLSTAGTDSGFDAQLTDNEDRVVYVSDVEVDAGSQVSAGIFISSMENGTAGFDLNLRIPDTSVAKFISISADPDIDSELTATTTDSTARLSTFDSISDAEDENVVDYRLATVTIEGVAAGSTQIEIVSVEVTNENGLPYSTGTEDGEVTVT